MRGAQPGASGEATGPAAGEDKVIAEKVQEQEGGSSSSAPVRRRKGGRFSDMVSSSHSESGARTEGREDPANARIIGARGSMTAEPATCFQDVGCKDGDASTRDDERSPHTSWTGMSGQAAQDRNYQCSSSEEAEGLPQFSALLSQLDADVIDIERQRAQAEAQAFDERRRKEQQDAAERSKEEERRRWEAAREAWERHCMAAEEAEERRRRANRLAGMLEEKTRKMLEKEAAKRRKQREDEKQQHKREKEQKKQEKMRSEAAKMSEKIRKMAESGYALGPSGWVRMDWLSGPDVGEPNLEIIKGPKMEEDEESEPEGDLDVLDDPYEVIDQRPEQVELDERVDEEAIPFEDVLANLDKQQIEGWASGAQIGDLDAVLSIVEADEQRDMAAASAVQVRQSYQELGKIEEEQDGVPADATESAARVLHAAKSRRPDANFGEAITQESALKPFNDFVEEKQEGLNSYEERRSL
ncbi:unnamed protein product [Effrenium voratum]|nr:unnamed protein product [Effrenium voratum]